MLSIDTLCVVYEEFFAKTDNYFFFPKNHVFLLCYVVIVLVSCIFIYIYILSNQNNPTAVWLGLIGMHNEKNMIFENC